MSTIHEYEYLWDGSEEGWVLVRAVGSQEELPVIYNRIDKNALLIDDDELYEQVVRAMLDHGHQVYDEIPR